jgi:hypothetical protein
MDEYSIREYIAEMDEGEAQFLSAEYDGALLGLCERHCYASVAAYDEEKLLALGGDLVALKASVSGDGQPVFVRSVGKSFAEIGEALGDTEVISFDGFENDVLGVASRSDWPDILLYRGEGCVETLMAQGLSRIDAEDYFGCNVGCCWAGDTTPAFLYVPLL